MRYVTIVLLSALMAVSCGKNDAVRPVGTSQPPTTAPAPTNPPAYSPPPGYYPPAGSYPPPQFQPQMPQGYPQAYYPFLPIHNYMQNDPRLQIYWGNTWIQWQNYCDQWNVDYYNFQVFWYDFCPQTWNSGASGHLYQYFDANFYFWLNGDTSFSPQANPGAFWQNYSGYQYAPTSYYGECWNGCY